MPLRAHGQLRKRWRYVGLYSPRLMLCAARAEVGPLGQCFWVLWDRESGRQHAHTSLRPGGGEVWMSGPSVRIEARGLRAELELGEAAAVESICPSGSGWGWTRKRAGVPIAATIELEGRRLELGGLGVDDESAGYHQRDTRWLWSAGVGTAADGRALAWNLVEGINDPPRNSERAVWVEGVPHEPAPVHFSGDTIGFSGEHGAASGDGPFIGSSGEVGSSHRRLQFATESERAREENFVLIRSSYSHRFGTFSGSLDGIDLAEGYGVMERHAARW